MFPFNSFCKKISLAVDAVLYDNNHFLVIKRAKEPFKHFYALPGGFVRYGESVEEAVSREVYEEIGIRIEFSREDQFKVYSHPKRDPRGHVVSVVFSKRLKNLKNSFSQNEEVEEVKKLPLNHFHTSLAFDHHTIINDFLKWKNVGRIKR